MVRCGVVVVVGVKGERESRREGKHVGVQACEEVCLGLGLKFNPAACLWCICSWE